MSALASSPSAAAAPPLAGRPSAAPDPSAAAGEGPIRHARVWARALPLAVGTMPVAFAFAAIAHGKGVPAAWVMAMSAGIYACSSQLALVHLLAAGQPAASVVLTCCVINLRHILMSSAMAPYVRRLGRKQLAAFAFLLCDEAFALHAAARREAPMRRRELHLANGILYGGWLVGNLAALVHPLPPATLARCGLDFAPVGMFVGLLSLLVRRVGHLFLAALCGAMSVAFSRAGEGGVGLMLTGLIGATLATAVAKGSERWRPRRGAKR